MASVGRSLELRVDHDLKALAPFRHRLDDWLESRGLPDPPRADVVLASHEAVANAIEHSSSSKPVLVKVEARSDGFVIEILDDGQWKPLREQPDERGRGIAMMKALVPDVQINSLGDGTTVRLFQHL